MLQLRIEGRGVGAGVFGPTERNIPLRARSPIRLSQAQLALDSIWAARAARCPSESEGLSFAQRSLDYRTEGSACGDAGSKAREAGCKALRQRIGIIVARTMLAVPRIKAG